MGINFIQLNLVDWFIIVLILVVVMMGIARGLGKSTSSLIIWGLSFVGAQLVSRLVSTPLSNYIDDAELLLLVPFSISFFFLMILFNLFFSFLTINTGNTSLSKLLGALVSIPLVLIQLLILVSFARLLTLNDSTQWLESQLIPVVLYLEFYWETYVMNGACVLISATQCYPY